METISVYTDGSCKWADKSGAWAWLALTEKSTYVEACGSLSDTTTNRAELTAILQALTTLPIGKAPMRIFSDSEYCVNSLNSWLAEWKVNGWCSRYGDPIANPDLMQVLDRAMIAHRAHRALTISWVKGHAKHKYNERVDYLAGIARKEKKAHYKKTGLQGEDVLELVDFDRTHKLTVCRASRQVKEATPGVLKKYEGFFAYNIPTRKNPEWQKILRPPLKSVTPLVRLKLPVRTTRV